MPTYRKMLNDLEIPAIREMMAIIPTQSKTTLALWATGEAAEALVPLWEKYFPDDQRPQAALAAAHDWLDGKIKLPQAKALILDCHAAARCSANPAAQAAARAIGQCCSVIHSASHSLGLAFYGALALAYDKLGVDAPWAELEAYAAVECGNFLADLKDVAVENEPKPCNVKWGC